MKFSELYPLYVQKIEKKNRTQAELDQILCWLTGYTQGAIVAHSKSNTNLEEFFAAAPEINPNATLITGKICGVQVEEIEDPLTKKVRWMDKLVDELAKGRAMEKILRK